MIEVVQAEYKVVAAAVVAVEEGSTVVEAVLVVEDDKVDSEEVGMAVGDQPELELEVDLSNWRILAVHIPAAVAAAGESEADIDTP